ncbi:MAG: DNA polymerase III subunit epsilon [Hoeflea sp.]|uniref:DNA polymerase III subunit epsilon n=1 Tax=Hoeflea sp. TaxID=1940281 RepID=UPI001E1389CF|nr:DNA polymerase III subunit epsilon [Hoeflea sp.]MBU4531777.1 DNA polymerase III subunit epsilon [Alphaproteobacteria bacterium]MBU4544633.1 DNA polymerase III subunit epsilon [Alphaproteobacteria bacterium]MBU4552864.1 DNA polymerase III subunit epsilon [Alphaproteobacteria bacterium]MBV1725053.1 DNA polymerase III subunit epsilon [Hoeflea sp.]MBV1761073.1 DNA polymerase III subunit epsilon [Hoeflea sp.]
MREIVFDTETTGLDNQTDRIIEIGCIELENQFPTGRSLHLFINPDGRKVHPDALAVHGITDAFLADKPVFADVAEEIAAFFEGAHYVAHNATFDMGFLNSEYRRLGRPPVAADLVIDTLALARRRHPMGPNSLDALCRRYGIDNSHRSKHGALLDAELLTDVYIEMLGGRQAALGLSASTTVEVERSSDDEVVVIGERPTPLPPRVSASDIQAHAALVDRIGAEALWRKSG